MLKTNTLDNILYKDKHYIKGAGIEVDDRDVNKLIRIGAIAGEVKQPEVKINVIRNPVEPKEEIKEVKLPSGRRDVKPVEKTTAALQVDSVKQEFPNKKMPRKYTKRSNNAVTDSETGGDSARFRK